MKHIKIAKLMQRLLVMLVITCVLCGDVMVANAQTTPVNSIPEGTEIEFSEETVEEAIVEDAAEEVVEEAVVEETVEEVTEEISEEATEEVVEEETIVEEATEEVVEEETIVEEATEEVVEEETIVEEATEEVVEEETVEEATEEVVEEETVEEATEEVSQVIVGKPLIEVTDEILEEAIGTAVEEVSEEATEEVSEIEEETVKEELAATASGKWYTLNWSYSGGTLTISGSGTMQGYGASNYPWYEYQGAVSKVVIGDYVTNIGYSAFYNMDNLTSVTLGSRVTKINSSAFESCGNLRSITIPKSVVTIESSAFADCVNLQSVTFASGSKLTEIGSWAFEGCTNLKKMAFPANLTTIGYQAFENCTNLANITFGSKLTTIDDYAFRDCLLLKNFTLPSSIRFIGYEAFEGCTSITALDLPYGLKTIEGYAFANCTSLNGNIKISGTVTSLGKGIFSGCSNVDSAEIYATGAISEYMFYNCTSLASVKMGDSVTSIGGSAFSDATSLKTVTFSSKITSIGDRAFKDCTSLTKANIPASTVSIGEYAFYNCTALGTVTFAVGLTSIGYEAFGYTGIASLKLPSTVTSLGTYAFYNCDNLKTVTLGSGLTTIPHAAFYDCDYLTTVTMGNNVNAIGEEAFEGCDSLSNITWPENLNVIYGDAFRNCDSLKTVQLPGSVNKIGGWAFAYCDSLVKFVAGENLTTIDSYVFISTPLAYFVSYAPNTIYGNYNIFSDKSGLTMYGWEESTTQTYANDNNIAFKALTSLSKPTHRKICNVVSGVHVYWNEVLGATTYDVYRKPAGGSWTKIKSGISATHYIDKAVTSGTTYYYKIVARRGSVKSSASAASEAITYVGTPDITSRVNNALGIKLGWNKINGATGYAIYRKPYAGNTWTRVTTIKGNSTFTWTDTSVKANNGTVYKYTIRALAGSNMATLSGCRNTGRTMARLSSQVMNSAKKASSTSIKCNWTTSSAVTGYEVRFMVGSTVYKTFTVGSYKTGTKTFTGLKAGQTYKIQVRTYKKVSGVGSFYSAWSEAKTVSL